MQEHKFEKAKASLQKVLTGPNKSVVDRAKVHIETCDQHLETPALHFKSSEEHFDYAISLMNTGEYDVARRASRQAAEAGAEVRLCAFGLAALHCLTGHVEDSLKTLNEAIQANPALRFQARNDIDFQNLAEDPRFTELLYPDPGVEDVESLKEESTAY